ncbi:MAG: D-alanyl-D-alanine carboxypeptidase/D-alanyl-D-alanine-endopeptidase [Planctomycetota bacterium]
MHHMPRNRLDDRTYRPGRCRRFRIAAALSLFLVLGPPALWAAVADSNPAAEAALRAELDRTLTGHGMPKVQMGASVVMLPSGEAIYERNATLPLIPASNMKLIVLAAAIDRMGPEHDFTTVLAIRKTDLVVIGGGDPTIGDEAIAKRQGTTITALFHEWARRLTAAGVKQIPGNLVIDDSIFDQQFVHPNWPKDQYQKWYEAPVGGLNFNANCTSVRVAMGAAGRPPTASFVPGNTLLSLRNNAVTGKKNTATVSRLRGTDEITLNGSVARAGVLGPVTVRDPGLYFAYVLKTVLAAKGIPIHGQVVRERIRRADGSLPNDCHLVAIHRTPLSTAIPRGGKNSLGVTAEAVLKLLGSRQGAIGSWQSGRSALRGFLDDVGVAPEQVVIDDGSGLSRKNRISAAAMTRVLHHTYTAQGGAFASLRDALACAGVDGTLEKRLRDPRTKGRIFAKTGYINGVRTLAGYVHTHSDQWLAFAFYYNQAAKTRPLTKIQDEACRLLVEWPDIKQP